MTYAICSRKDSSIYSVDEDHPRPECIVISDAHIADRGSLEYIRTNWGDKYRNGPATASNPLAPKSGVKIYFLPSGHALFPGFSDSHAHVLATQTSSEVVTRTRQYVLDNPDVLSDTTRWIVGVGWDQNLWEGQSYPLATVLFDRPIVLYRIDVHALWVSPKVLQLLGSLPEIVEGGLIVRDDVGSPTGLFIDTAMALIESIKPAWSENEMLDFFRTAVQDGVRFGLTTIHDAETLPFMIEFFRRMADQGRLPIRLYLMAHLDDAEYWGDRVGQFQHAGGRLTLRSVKLFADALGPHCWSPYSDKADTQGTLIFPPRVINGLVHQFVKNGWQTDRANQIVLDAFEEVLESSSTNSSFHRHRIEHAQIMTPEDIIRLAKLEVIASIQPTHATSDMWYAERRLGPERIRGAYAWRTLLENGAKIAIGSDAPVESLNPLLGFYAAVTRLSPEGTSPNGEGGWYPQQRLTRDEALRGMTIDAAFASFTESTQGSLLPGKRADLVVLSRDIMGVPPEDILKAEVRATIVDGRLVYGSLDF
ncbi:hypothetical protein BS47DRAFT_1372500 [Hydnum rufescens UP504]|uniref:Amidohydrolase 3 domain-containing protein n=1 Tax=Hydnum rufescens UP504 TaxID=1448309 RepID=A0A9P6DX49_9AGAM|nr:hypothetical protein BS47DRAFT_1372500 [Hydnum rufescens UP504]